MSDEGITKSELIAMMDVNAEVVKNLERISNSLLTNAADHKDTDKALVEILKVVCSIEQTISNMKSILVRFLSAISFLGTVISIITYLLNHD